MDGLEDRGNHIAALLRANYKAKERRSEENEIWLDHFCVFHDDRHKRSATFQPTTGVYHCWGACGTKSLEEVERRFGVHHHQIRGEGMAKRGQIKLLEQPRPVHSDRQLPIRTPDEYKRVRREINYMVTWPDGTPSHIKRRLEYTRPDLYPKEEFWYHPDGETPGQPKEFWPIYDCSQIPRTTEGFYVIVVEGLKGVDAGNAHCLDRGTPARFLTCGAREELKKHAETLARYILTLPQIGVLLWPDNDPPGIDAMKHVNKILEQHGL